MVSFGNNKNDDASSGKKTYRHCQYKHILESGPLIMNVKILIKYHKDNYIHQTLLPDKTSLLVCRSQK
jgi:hypothetical protein